MSPTQRTFLEPFFRESGRRARRASQMRVAGHRQLYRACLDGSVFLGRIPRDCHPQRLTVGFHVRFRRVLQCAPALHDHLMASGEALVRAQPHPAAILPPQNNRAITMQSSICRHTSFSRCFAFSLPHGSWPFHFPLYRPDALESTSGPY